MTSGRAGQPLDRPRSRGTPTGLHLLTAAVVTTALVAAVVGLSLPVGLPVDASVPRSPSSPCPSWPGSGSAPRPAW